MSKMFLEKGLRVPVISSQLLLSFCIHSKSGPMLIDLLQAGLEGIGNPGQIQQGLHVVGDIESPAALLVLTDVHGLTVLHGGSHRNRVEGDIQVGELEPVTELVVGHDRPVGLLLGLNHGSHKAVIDQTGLLLQVIQRGVVRVAGGIGQSRGLGSGEVGVVATAPTTARRSYSPSQRGL